MGMERPRKATWFQNALGSLFFFTIIYAVGTTTWGQRWTNPKTLAYVGAALVVLGMLSVSSAIIISRMENRQRFSS